MLKKLFFISISLLFMKEPAYSQQNEKNISNLLRRWVHLGNEIILERNENKARNLLSIIVYPESYINRIDETSLQHFSKHGFSKNIKLQTNRIATKHEEKVVFDLIKRLSQVFTLENFINDTAEPSNRSAINKMLNAARVTENKGTLTQKADEILQNTNQFSNYNSINGPTNNKLMFSVLEQLDPVEGWKRSNITLLNNPLYNQNNKEIKVTSTENGIFGSGEFTISLDNLYFDSESTSRYTFKDRNNENRHTLVQEVHFLIEQTLNKNGQPRNKINSGNLDRENIAYLLSCEAPIFNNLSTNWEHVKSQITPQIKNMWHRILLTLKTQGIKYASIPAIGLGAFLGSNHQKKIATLYFEALIELLESENYKNSFDRIYYNPGKFHTEFHTVLPQASTSSPLRFCDKDTVFLAQNLSREGFLVAFINPSNQNVLEGRVDIGNSWKYNNNLGEQYIAAITTAVLGSKGISSSWHDPYKQYILRYP